MKFRKNYIKGRILTLLLLAFSAGAIGQNKSITFTGAGRLWLNSDRLGGAVHEDTFVNGVMLPGDTVTARRELSGHTIFDLGFDIRPIDEVEIHAITRVYSDLDGFWGAGIVFSVRELYARGIIHDRVRYKLGDIDVKLTPYTLWNSDSDMLINRPIAFQLFSDVIDYENFYKDNQWRQQGAHVDFGFDFSKGIQSLNFQGMISKNRQTDFFFTPDRLMALANVDVRQSDMFRIGLNHIRLFDVAQTAQFAEASAHHIVNTVDFSLKPIDDKPLEINAEAGYSRVYYEMTENAPEDTSQQFFDLSATYELKKSFTVEAGYRLVQSGFRSPGAQSRRVVFGNTPDAFGFITNQEIKRSVSLIDILEDYSVYNPYISPQLAEYNPAYSNVTPYGRATPNRQGFSVNLNYAPDSSVVNSISLNSQFLQEVSGRGISSLRNFTTIGFEGAFGLEQLLGWENALELTIGAAVQNTTRDGLSGLGEGLDGIGEVDLNNTVIQASLSASLNSRLDVLGSFMSLSAQGNEYVPVRDNFNQITDYEERELDLSESLLAAGLRYRFTDTVHLTCQLQQSASTNALDAANAWEMNRLVVLFNMFF